MRPALLRHLGVCAGVVMCFVWIHGEPAPEANRFIHLDSADPFHVSVASPRLTTPQWIGEPGVEAVVILSIDDLRQTRKYEEFLRPILERLKQIDGRAPVSIMANDVPAEDPQLAAWLKEGVSLEVHTVTHRHPILSETNFAAGAADYHDSVAWLNRIPGNRPVACRLPYCDSLNVASPRFFAEIFNRVNAAGQFLAIDSSVMNLFTAADASLPRELVLDARGRERFRKYLPAETNALTQVRMQWLGTLVENHPYPYVVGRLCWEFPISLPSDWEAHNAHGSTNAVTLADWEAALDATVLKQGVFTLCFHPHSWSSSAQLVQLIDHAVRRHGGKVKFLTFREAAERLDRHLLAGNPLRAPDGGDNGVRLLDLNGDGFQDVVIANARARLTRLWQPDSRTWRDRAFPADLAGAQFGVLDQQTILLQTSSPDGPLRSAWRFDGEKWTEAPELVGGLQIDGQPVVSVRSGHDRGLRLRDVNRDSQCELLVANESQNAIFGWSAPHRMWEKLDYALPKGTAFVDAAGRDAGLRFVDLNGDGYDDVVFSGTTNYVMRLFVSTAVPELGWKIGWNDEIVSGPRTGTGADPLPPFVLDAPERNHGAWFHDGQLFVQNERTSSLPDAVDRRPVERLLRADQPPSLTPRESLATIRVTPGFKVELVAEEPLTMDPVCFEWGPDGKLWVAEMGDYPLGMDGHGAPGGVIRFLEDTDGDGRYDKSTVFLDHVNFPNGVMPWRNGVLVSAAPEMFYAEDTNGDGRADVRKVLFTGFVEGNQQHRINGFDYGLDNWIYAANGDSGGVVKSLLTGAVVDIRGRDVRFRPDDGAFATQAGQSQYGRHRDDWGNWFGNNNVNWLWHYHRPEHYLVRNPHLPVKGMKQSLAQYTNSAHLFPTSRFLQRFNWPDAVNLVTSASAPMPYRDDLFGPDFANNVFICEPVYQTIHREVLEPDGVSFTSYRAAAEPNSEFFTSTDNWCRPVYVKTGPDGAVYVADMYRFVIEHPEWIPVRMQKRLDLRAGDTQGRIYRISPENTKLRPVPRLDRVDTAGLVAALDHPSGWQRDTAQRLLIHGADKSAVPLLATLLREARDPRARLHALCTLEGMQALTLEIVLGALRDAEARIREHAVRVSETLLRAAAPPPELMSALLALVNDASIRVRYQLAFTLGESTDPAAARALVALARQNTNDDVQLAVMSSAVPHVETMLAAAVEAEAKLPAEVTGQLLQLAVALDREPALAKALQRLDAGELSVEAASRFAAIASVLDALDRRKRSLKSLQERAGAELRAAIGQLESSFARARQLAAAKTIPADAETDLTAAVRLLGRGLTQQSADVDALVGLLRPQVPPGVQQAALRELSRVGDPRTGEKLLAEWRGYGPVLRSEVLNTLLSRSEWLDRLLAEVERGAIAPPQIDPAHQQTLLTHAQAAVRERAEKLFTAAHADRQAVVQANLGALALRGEPSRAAETFRKNCATCHQLNGEGTAIGADLGTVADKPADYLLTAILDPNRAVEARYISYTAVTADEREFSGIITIETPNSLTLRNATGEATILRSDLVELTSSSLSLMPEGLEAGLQPADLADLIAFIKSAGSRAK